MDETDAAELIRGAIPRPGGTWADLGAGDGTFTRALVDVLGSARIHAIERDAKALAKLRRWASLEAPNVVPEQADFTRPVDPPGRDGAFDGILLANSLHYVRDAAAVLQRLVRWLRPGGRVVLVEYDRRPANPWVPYPIPAADWPKLARTAGLSNPRITATRPSSFGGDLYVAVAEVPSHPDSGES